ncbi:hypothetical protein GCM10011507_28190 [Edaphobacter acidisoli]|uniref:Uncharacterized protein n=1 Tax=Edaphobacter acidisoli TaxID=2040573 RepID=A0A916RXK1_9BACT|nr:hypothetical protein GCM10011507_28190 [Edaphobacter acidisoli]
MEIRKNTDPELAVRIAKLWPHREHEASSVNGLLCRARIHRWKRLDLAAMVPDHDVRFCFWCSKARIDGTTYDA